MAEHLGRYCPLTEAERDVLASLRAGVRQYRRGEIVRREGDRADEMFVVQRGWLFCSAVLEDGRRQIIRFHFRGDMLGQDSLGFAVAPESITALTDAELCLLDLARFPQIFVDHPRLAALLHAHEQIERIMLTDRLISLGRSSARGRVAALLLWIMTRLRLVDPALGDSFVLPMTQEEVGDATGLTGVHVNRTLRALEARPDRADSQHPAPHRSGATHPHRRAARSP